VIAPMREHVAEIRAQIPHPIIDADGHHVEVTPVLLDYVKDVGGTAALARFEQHYTQLMAHGTADGRGNWHVQPRHWVLPADTLDRATASLPRLYHERMDEIGLDVSLVYPTHALAHQMIGDDDLRRTACRAVNRYMADVHRGLEDRLIPVGAVPMHTPAEAIEELEHAVLELGLRTVVIPSFVKRPLVQVHRAAPDLDDLAFRIDAYGVDSDHDYDPFWARCCELGVAPAVHTPTWGTHGREAATNYTYTHIGQFSAGAEIACRSLLLGGVFHRFPRLRIAALEGGTGWAVSLYAGLLGHWEKRNGEAISQYDPARIDQDRMRRLAETYASPVLRSRLDDVVADLAGSRRTTQPARRDDFDASPFASADELRDMFTSRIYIGCEADDPLTALAFDTARNPLGARFRAVLGSDVSHWDVPDVAEVLAEAYELVEQGLIDEHDFEELAFSNAVRLHGGANPEFFAGTRVEAAATHALSGEP
jgi:predicted TIM-barrel fold metal-dependent hydrolase